MKCKVEIIKTSSMTLEIEGITVNEAIKLALSYGKTFPEKFSNNKELDYEVFIPNGSYSESTYGSYEAIKPMINIKILDENSKEGE